jgi:hypothetical protein
MPQNSCLFFRHDATNSKSFQQLDVVVYKCIARDSSCWVDLRLATQLYVSLQGKKSQIFFLATLIILKFKYTLLHDRKEM